MTDELKRLRDQLVRIESALCDTRPKQAVGEMVVHAISLADAALESSLAANGATPVAYVVRCRDVDGDMYARAAWVGKIPEDGAKLYIGASAAKGDKA